MAEPSEVLIFRDYWAGGVRADHPVRVHVAEPHGGLGDVQTDVHRALLNGGA